MTKTKLKPQTLVRSTRLVRPQILGYVRLRRLSLTKALRLRNRGDVIGAKIWERGADSYANEVCDLIEALRPNTPAHRPGRKPQR